MRSFLVVLCFFIVPGAWAVPEVERRVAVSVQVESEAQAKPLLLHTAVAELLREKGAELGIDPVAFDQALTQRFEAFFAAYKERRLVERFGREALPTLPEDQRQTFFNGLEGDRFLELVRFARLSQLVESHSFKSIEKTPESTWKASLNFTLKPESVKIMGRRLTAPVDQQFERLFLVPELEALGFSWETMGVKDQTGFEATLAESWGKWLVANSPENLGGVETCDQVCRDVFSRWLQRSADDRSTVSETILNGLWLRVTFNLRQLAHRAAINEWEFEWSGSAVLQDANTKMVLASLTLETERRTWRGLDQKALNSALASAIYRSALEPLTRIVRRIREAHRPSRVTSLTVQGHRQLGDILSLIDLLRKEGKDLELDLKLATFGQREAQLTCTYRGEEKSFTDLLSRLKALRSTYSYRLVSDLTGAHPMVKLIAE